jgi:hypothetical protein
MKAKVIHAHTLQIFRILWIIGVQDRQIDLAIGQMNRAIFGAEDFLELEDFFVKVSKPLRLMGQERKMS